MKHIIFILFILATLPGFSQEYNLESVDGKCIMRGSIDCNGTQEEIIFSNIILWIYQNDAGAIKEKDFGRTLSMSQTLSNAQEPNTYFNTKITFTTEQGHLNFVISDIVRHSKSGFTYSAVPFEKLQPEKKSKDKYYTEQFTDYENQIIKSLTDYITENKSLKISPAHLSSIKEGRVTVGMNETECMLVTGKPKSTLNTDGETQWLINSSYYVFFKNGKVSNIVK